MLGGKPEVEHCSQEVSTSGLPVIHPQLRIDPTESRANTTRLLARHNFRIALDFSQESGLATPVVRHVVLIRVFGYCHAFF
jgi:hypothetical protein